MTASLRVLLGQTEVGLLQGDEGGRSGFRLNSSYVQDPDHPVLGQAFEDEPERVWTESRGVPRWFANLLPEEGSRLRTLLAGANEVDPLDDLALLRVLGQDLPGAVIVEPTEADGGRQGSLPEVEPGELPTALGLRFSVAGMQLKFSVSRQGDRITLPARGQLGDCYLKVSQGGYVGLAENEAAMMAWARAAGFETADTWLVDRTSFEAESELTPDALPKALLVKRFDRDGAARIHQEDFAQVARLPPRLKYEHVTFEKLGVLVHAILGEEGLDEYLRRLALMIAQGNADAHLKNWSLQYRTPTRASWSPLYDQVCTVAWPRVGVEKVDNSLALKLVGRREFGQVDRSLLSHLAARLRVPQDRVLACFMDTLKTLREVWPALSERRDLPVEHAQALSRHWERVPLLREAGSLPE